MKARCCKDPHLKLLRNREYDRTGVGSKGITRQAIKAVTSLVKCYNCNKIWRSKAIYARRLENEQKNEGIN